MRVPYLVHGRDAVAYLGSFLGTLDDLAQNNTSPPPVATRFPPQLQQIAPDYFPNVDPAKIQFISGRVPLENNTSSDLKSLLKGAQSRNVSKCHTSAILSLTYTNHIR